jgi:hypothetical protein
MKHETYEALSMRLEYVRNMADRLEEIDEKEGIILYARWREEQRGLEDALVGEDPLVLAGLDWLRQRYDESDLVLWQDEKLLMRIGGNEHWVLADVAIGDDYGVIDFWSPYAILRTTGAVYRVERDGTVADDPINVPAGSPYDGPLEREPHR